MQRICSIYRSAKTEGMYLYVDKAEGLARVPEALMQRFGKAELAMTLALHSERKLARADVAMVLQAIADNGFFLQLPPHTEHDSSTTRIINENSF
ncbi:MAG TPA: YcgL domain-containing protein [Spongiibacteraceae bacterium]|nr:YcgL domain-containing protein [Spongiibacteraceae bacterium]